MPVARTLPLRVATDIEPLRSWDEITNPMDLVIYIARLLSVDPSSFASLQEVSFGSQPPSGDDLGKLFIKNTTPVGIGIFNGSGYSMIYQYPPNVPLLWTKGNEEFPSYLKRLSADQLQDYGLTNPSEGFYFMLQV